MNKNLKIIFAGTPDFSVPFLLGLENEPDFSILGVITQPDKVSGRKQELSASPVKIEALRLNLEVFQPDNLRTDEQIKEKLNNLKADLLVVVAYGQIIPKEILDLFPLGCINVHPSLLPKYRGASPIQNTILNGDLKTGISIMLMDEKMDHGPILSQLEYNLTGEETNQSLHLKLADLGVDFLIKSIKDFLTNKINPQPQDDARAIFCKMIKKEDGKINWSDSAKNIKQKIYAFYPWPATYGNLNNRRIKFFPPVKIINEIKRPGEVFNYENQLAISCLDGSLIIDKWQLEGKKEMKNEDFLRGKPDVIGNCLI